MSSLCFNYKIAALQSLKSEQYSQDLSDNLSENQNNR